MITLHIDFESRSILDLTEVGIDNYAKHPSTEILMMAYAFGDGQVKLWEPRFGPPPTDVSEVLLDPNVVKVAWNAGFERNMLWRKLGIFVPFEQWADPMVNARYFSLPGSLEQVGEILSLPADMRKIADGDRLIKLFSEPAPIKKSRRQATNENTLFDISPIADVDRPAVFNDWNTHAEDWEKFGEYCKQDVVSERALGERLNHKQCAPLPEREKKLWYLDQQINSFGMPADRKFVENSLELAMKHKEELTETQKQLTGLENPNSNAQMLKWAQAQGYPYNSLRKEPVSVALKDPSVRLTPLGRQVLTLRKQSGKTSYTKLAAILEALSDDNFLRDQFLFMGSARAGRWSGRQTQLHNLARPIKALEEDGALDKARELIYAKDYQGIKDAFATKDQPGSVIDVVTSCIRSSFVAPKGYRFNVCDLNAIENRVLGWVTGEDKILSVFRENRCPYLSFASLMYNIPYSILEFEYKHKVPDAKEKRQVAKPAVLGAGYRLSGGEWGTNRYGDRVKTGLWGYAENMGVIISQELAVQSVKAFREEYHNVVRSWYDYEDAVLRCINGQGPQEMCINGPRDSTYGCQSPGRANGHLIWCDRRKRKDGKFVLRIHLPSGRSLHYVNAQVVEREMPGRDGKPYRKKSMAYEGVSQETKRWEILYSHGGRLIENVVQAISRDVLSEAMLDCQSIGLQLVGHVHDELITLSEDTDEAPGLLDLQSFMSKTPVWAPGLPLHAEGYEGTYYRK